MRWSVVLALLTACAGIPSTASCPEAADVAQAQREGHLFRAKALAKRSCKSAELVAAIDRELLDGDASAAADSGRAKLAANDVAGAQRAFEQAVARAEARAGKSGEWQWRGFTQHRIATMAYTPDGKLLAVGDAEGRVDVYSTSSMRILRQFRVNGYPRAFRISPNGKWLASGREVIQVWDLETGALVNEFAFELAYAFSPSNRLLASKSTGGFVELDVATKKELRSVDGVKLDDLFVFNNKVLAVDGVKAAIYDALSLDKTSEFSLASRINEMRVFGNEIVSTTDKGVLVHDYEGNVRWNVDGRYYNIATAPGLIAAVNTQGRFEIYDKDGTLLRTLPAGRNFDALAFHPRGTLLAAGGWDGANLWDAKLGKHLDFFARPPVSAVALAFDARGDKLAVGSSAGHATVWTLATGTASSVTVRPGEPVGHLAFGPDGDLATGTSSASNYQRAMGGVLAVWNDKLERRWWTEFERLEFLDYRPHDGSLSTATVVSSPDATVLALQLWTRDGKVAKRLDLDAGRSFQWRPDGNALLGTTNNELVTQPLDGKPTRIDLHHYEGALHPDGNLYATSAADGRVALWDLAKRSPIRVVFDDIGNLGSLAWTPDGKTLVTASYDTASLWDPATGNRRATFVGPSQITSLAMHPNGRIMATGHTDGRVVLWTLSTGEQIATLHAPNELTSFVVAGRAIDGTPADDILAWSVDGVPLPAQGAFDRERVPHLLASRLAAVPTEVVHRDLDGARVPPAPPACYPRDADNNGRSVRAVNVSADGKRVSVCLEWTYLVRGNVKLHPLNMCFEVELAAGKYAAREPTPREALGIGDPNYASATHEDGKVHVCKDGTCRDIPVRTLASADRVEVTVDDNAKLVAVAYNMMDTGRDAVLVYDVATQKRVSQFIAEGENSSYAFVDETLIVTTTPCAGPCSSSSLFDARRNKWVGGVAVNTSSLSPTKLAGNVWAFNDWDSRAVVFQNIKTGKITGKFDLPKRACTNEPDAEYVSCEGISLLTAGSNIVVFPSARPGDVMLVDQKGKLLADYSLPVCK